MNNTHMSQFIPPSAIQKSAGTWTPTLSTHLVSDVRTAADASFTLLVPIPIPSNSQYRAGSKLKSIDFYYKVATGACDDFALVELKKSTLPATAVAFAGADVTISIDTAHDTAAERKAVADHTMTVTLSTAAYIDDGDAYTLVMTVDAAANTVFTIFGARANYELRI